MSYRTETPIFTVTLRHLLMVVAFLSFDVALLSFDDLLKHPVGIVGAAFAVGWGIRGFFS